MRKIPIEVSARHIHLSQEDLDKLFGKGYKLKKLKKLSQLSDFAAKETLDIQAGVKKILKVRVVGPVRKETQVELSMTDAVFLGISPPVRKSGDLKVSPGIVLIGPKRKIKIKKGVIIPWRHIHCSTKEAKVLKLKNGMMVSLKIKGARSLTFHNIRVRINKNYRLYMHLDTDEGNAAGITKEGEGKVIV